MKQPRKVKGAELTPPCLTCYRASVDTLGHAGALDYSRDKVGRWEHTAFWCLRCAKETIDNALESAMRDWQAAHPGVCSECDGDSVWLMVRIGEDGTEAERREVCTEHRNAMRHNPDWATMAKIGGK